MSSEKPDHFRWAFLDQVLFLSVAEGGRFAGILDDTPLFGDLLEAGAEVGGLGRQEIAFRAIEGEEHAGQDGADGGGAVPALPAHSWRCIR
jgi:hypothetical protein